MVDNELALTPIAGKGERPIWELIQTAESFVKMNTTPDSGRLSQSKLPGNFCGVGRSLMAIMSGKNGFQVPFLTLQ